MRDAVDVLVVGAGHAAVEAALAARRLGASVAIVTLDPDNVAGMPCNPAVGGPGKAQIVAEIDALGGEMALATDNATVQMRVLNSSKGPAVRSLRAQVDKALYRAYMTRALTQAGVEVVRGMVVDLETVASRVRGVRLADGFRIGAGAVVLCTGVYLESRIIIGPVVKESGPMGEPNATGLSGSLRRLGFEMGRFKTGTSPRIARDSVRWEELTREEGTKEPTAFSFMTTPRTWEANVCYSTYTTAATHEVVRKNVHRAPLFNGTIKALGPRYCPSIEDKVVRHPERQRHQIYLEMESEDSPEVYILGLSTSLPEEVQVEMVRTLPGLENAVITRPGYAIEYDFLLPKQLRPTLETQLIQGLFAAGQINGTSGYEEAAAQGLVAGVNAALYLKGRPGLVLSRDQAYIGVLIDDLIGTVIEEPYRMLTSRAEYRLLLRQSNADLRLTPTGREVGLVSDERWERFLERRSKIERGLRALKTRVGGVRVEDLLRKPEKTLEEFLPEVPGLSDLPPDVLREVETQAKYAGFVERQEREARRLRRYEGKAIPQWLDPEKIPGLSSEGRDKLLRYRPATVGRAASFGVSPSDILVLLAFLEGRSSA